MSNDLLRLLAAFGTLIMRRRIEQRLTPEALAKLAHLPDADTVTLMERGEREPTLSELFWIASALRTSAFWLFLDIIGESRRDVRDLGLYKSRASDFAILYRLGYHPDPGEFCELPRTYNYISEALVVASTLNAERKLRGRLLLDTVTTYVRTAHAPVDKEGQP